MHPTTRFAADKVGVKLTLLALLSLAPSLLLAQGSSSTLDRVRSTGQLTLGYFPAAKPHSYQNSAGAADGYTVALCRGIAAVMKSELQRPDLAVRFVPLDADPIAAVRDGRIDLACVPMQPTLSRRAEVSFSIPVFAGGTSVLLRRNASKDFRDLLDGRATLDKPLWRGQPQLQILNTRKFAVISGSASERWVAQRKRELGVTSLITPVGDLQTGLQRVLSGEADGFLADRSVLMELARNDPSGKEVMVVDRVWDPTQMALPMARGDEDFRLLVDKTLSRLYRSGLIAGIYEKHLGPPNAAARAWFKQVAEPE